MTDSRRFTVIIAAAAVGTFILAWALLMAAHAATAEAPPAQAAVPVAVSGIGDTIAVWLLGAIALFSAIRTVLQFVAPRTKTTWDDTQLSRVNELLDILQGRAPAPAVKRDTQSGRVSMSALAVLCVVGAAIGALTISCATVREKGGVGAQVFTDCLAPDIESALPDLVPLAKSAIMRWVTGTGSVDTGGIEADMASIKSDLGKCAIASAIAILTTPTSGLAGAPKSSPMLVDGAGLRAAFTSGRARLGWAPVKTSGGTL